MSDTSFSPLRFFLTWLSIGIQSFGGGSATMALIRRAAVEDLKWVGEAEFTRDWALVQMAPGINLVGFVILLARRVDGARGISLALTGLLLPSASVTVMLAALYERFDNLKPVQAAMHGLLPATVGLGMVTTVKMALPPLDESRRESRASLYISLGVVLGCVVAEALFQNIPVVVLLLGGGAFAAVYRWAFSLRKPTAPETAES